MADAFREAGALWAEQSTDAAEAEALFAARRLAYPALERLGPVLTEDVCVPRSQVPAMLPAIEGSPPARRADRDHRPRRRRQPAPAASSRRPATSGARGGAGRVRARSSTAAIALGGTVTGEHGVGLLKRDGMRAELDPGALAMQAAMKPTLDPLDLFNPGKVYGDPAADTSLSWSGPTVPTMQRATPGILTLPSSS